VSIKARAEYVRACWKLSRNRNKDLSEVLRSASTVAIEINFVPAREIAQESSMPRLLKKSRATQRSGCVALAFDESYRPGVNGSIDWLHLSSSSHSSASRSARVVPSPLNLTT
jgi:hypothetical protein